MANKIYHCGECQQKITSKLFQHKEINDWNKFCSENCLSLYYYGKVCSSCQQKKLKVAELEGQNCCQDCFTKEPSSKQLEAELEELFRQAEERVKKNLAEIDEHEQKKKKKQEENVQQKDTPQPPFLEDELLLGKCLQCQREAKFPTDWCPLRHSESKDEEVFCSLDCFNEYYGKSCHRCQQKNTTYWTVKNSNRVYCSACKEVEEKENRTKSTNHNLPVNFESNYQPKKTEPIKIENNDPISIPPTNQPKPNENQDAKKEAGLLLKKLKVLEGVNKEIPRVFNKEVMESLIWLKEAQANNTLAYQIVNGKDKKIDKIIEQFEQLKKRILKSQQEDNKFSGYAPWLIGGIVMVFLVVIWIVIKRRNKKLRKNKL